MDDIRKTTPEDQVHDFMINNGFIPLIDFKMYGQYAEYKNAHAYLFTKENTGLVQINCYDQKVETITLHLNGVQKTESSNYLSYSTNLPWGNGDYLMACDIKADKGLLAALKEIHSYYDLRFPFLFNYYIPNSNFFNNDMHVKYAEELGLKTGKEFNYENEQKIFFHLLGNNKQQLDPHNHYFNQQGYYNSDNLSRWNTIVLQAKAHTLLNSVDNDFYQQIKEFFLADAMTPALEKLLNSSIVHHTTECGHHLGHIAAAVDNDEIKSALFGKFMALPQRDLLLSMPDNNGLTPILLLLDMANRSAETMPNALHYFNILLQKDDTGKSLLSENSGFWTCLRKMSNIQPFIDIIHSQQKYTPDTLISGANTKEDTILTLKNTDVLNYFMAAKEKEKIMDHYFSLNEALTKEVIHHKKQEI